MKTTGIIILGCLLAVAGAAQVWAGPGQSGAQVLLQELGARPAGMGGAYTALAQDIYSTNINPAGLAGLEKVEVSFMHLSGVEGLYTEWLAAAVPVPGLGSLAIQALYRGQPAIDNEVPGEAAVDVKDMVFGISYALTIVPGLRAGVDAKLASLTLGPADASALAVDLGAQYSLDEATRLGVAARNLGSGVKFHQTSDPLPLTMAAGVSRSLLPAGPHVLTADLDVDYQAPEQNWVTRIGAEYWYKQLLALRAGYANSSNKTADGLSFGLGFRFKLGQVEMTLDYAMRPQVWESSDFETENLLSLGARF